MANDTLQIHSVELSVQRLSKVVERQFGCALAYEPIDAITHDHTLTLYTDLHKGDPVSAGDWVFFPVFVGQDLAGAARIANRDLISQDSLKRLHSVIRMVIENQLTNNEQIEQLAQIEDNLRNLSESRQAVKANNVFKISNYQNNLFPITKPAHNKALNFSFLIESRNPDDIFKMALEIHSRSGRFAFLPFSDLSPSAYASADSFKNLGAMSIFVSEVTALTFEQQQALVLYFASERDKDCPQIIAGTNLTMSELKKSCKVLPTLWPHLAVGFLSMTQPFEIYKRENLLEFFYDSLTGRNQT